MGSRNTAVSHMTWPDMVRSGQYRGRWVALDNVRYNPATSRPVEADVVDADEDLSDLCARMRESDRTSCAILFCANEFCDGEETQDRVVRRLPRIPPRAAQH